MKRTLTTIAFALIIFAASAQRAEQPQRNERPNRAEFHERKTAYIIEQMQLNDDEKELFLTLYNAYTAEIRLSKAAIAKAKKAITPESTTPEYEAFLSTLTEEETKQNQLKTKLIHDLLKIFPAEKVYTFNCAKEEFNKSIIRNVNKKTVNEKK